MVDPDADPTTAPDVLLRRVADDPNGELVRFLDGPAAGVRLSAADVAAAAARAAAAFTAAGVRPGDTVLTWVPPSPRLLATWFGLAADGAVEVPLAVETTAATARATLDLVAPRWVVVDEHLLRPSVPGSAALEQWRAEGGRLLTLGARTATGPELDLAAAARRLDPLAPAVAMGTSGTTGRSKAALLPHAAGVRQARRVCRTMGYGPDDVLYNVFPWHHVNARHSAFLAAVVSGARLVVGERFSVSGFWSTCRDEGVTAFNFMGVMATMLQGAPASPADRDHVVTRAYGAPAPAGQVAAFAERFGVRLLESYASTELADVAANSVDRSRSGTAGAVLPEYTVAIRDGDGRDLPAGTVGTVHARPRRPGTAFLGYLGDGPATAETIDADGWIRTGDLGSVDVDGFLRHAGRRADVIRHRGENVSAAEVGEVVADLPGVRSVAVVGVASPWGEQDVALAVASDVLTPDVVHGWCVQRLPRHAVPRYVRVVPELPVNRTLKLDLARLAAPEWITEATVFEPPARRERAVR